MVNANGTVADAAALGLRDVLVRVSFATLHVTLVPEVNVDPATRASAVSEDPEAGSVDRKPVTIDLNGNGDLAAGRQG